jgi:hypothetical protein
MTTCCPAVISVKREDPVCSSGAMTNRAHDVANASIVDAIIPVRIMIETRHSIRCSCLFTLFGTPEFKLNFVAF